MDLRTLRCCEAIARLGSITRAAEELHIAQPAISVAVQKLEDELGVKLFTRHPNRRVTPTPEGQILIRRAQRMFQEADSARRELADAMQLRTGEVKLGMPPMYGVRIFPMLLAAFRKAYSGIVVTALEGSAGEVSSMLDDGVIDLAILEARRVRPGWQHVAIGEEEIVLGVPIGHPLAKRKRISGKDLQDVEMVVFNETFLQRNVLDKRARKAGVQYRIAMQSNYVPLVHESAAAGLGAATLLRSMAETDARLVAVSFDPPEVFRFDLCWLSERYLSRANRTFADFIRQWKPGADAGDADTPASAPARIRKQRTAANGK